MSVAGSFSLTPPREMSEVEAAEARAEWVRVVRSLVRQIRAWVEAEPEWSVVSEQEKEVSERPIGRYAVPTLTFRTPDARVVIDSVARNIGGKGAVELYVLPTLRRVKMLHDDAGGEWQILTDSGISLRQPWNRDTFVQIVEDMTRVDL
jgi:hypothetical protein